MRKFWLATLSFFLYALIGWLIEAAWLALIHEPQIHGALWPLPLKPSYGLAGLFVAVFRNRLLRIPLAVRWLLLSLALGAFEVLVGIISFRVYGRPLWQYSGGPLNILGYTDAWHAGAWGALAIFLIHVTHPLLQKSSLALSRLTRRVILK